MIVDCISDLHGFYPELKGEGDLLIVAGDLTGADRPNEYRQFNEWICRQKYRLKVVIGGNHDNLCQRGIEIVGEDGKRERTCPISAEDTLYLCDSGTELDGLKIWGSPWTLRFEGINPLCAAYCLKYDSELAEKWKLIPDDTDILITHSPPYGIGDVIQRGASVGSRSLLDMCGTTESRVQPMLWVFGHIHECGGQKRQVGRTTLVNASYVNVFYQPVHAPIRIEL